ncbi:MAG: insulinase family protein [Gemmatimonadota bacterium]
MRRNDSLPPGAACREGLWPRATLPGMALAVVMLLPPPALAQQVVPPDPLPAQPIEFPGFQELTLENGLRVILVPYGSQPVVSLRLYALGGSAIQPPEKAGAASLTSTVLTRGTASRDAREIASTIEGIGGSLSAGASRDFFTVTAGFLADDLTAGMELFADVAMNANFPEEEVELARRQTLSSLQAQMGDAQSVASRRFAAALYGQDHPYGVEVTPASVSGLTRQELQEYRDRVLRPRGSLLMVAGGFDPVRVEEEVRRRFEDWEDDGGVVELDLEDPDRERTRVRLVHRPGSSQSVVMLGHLGLPAGHPDYFPMLLANHVLGGGSSSRLFRSLREEKGWSYSAYSELNRQVGTGFFRATTEVPPEVTDSTVIELARQLSRLRTEEVPADELDAARDFLAGSFPLRLETADQVANQVASTLLLGLPLDDLTRFPERIRAVSAGDVHLATQEHLHPDQAVVVVVGDGRRVLEPLEAIAEVELMDVQGRPLERDEILGTGASLPPLDPSRLREGVRVYNLVVEGNVVGTSEFRLRREDGDWVSETTTEGMVEQETHLRFSSQDFSPLALTTASRQGPLRIAAEVAVEDGRLLGSADLPEQMGGSRSYDEVWPEGTLLPGMDDYALAIAELDQGARLSIPVFDVTQGSREVYSAEITGREEVETPAGTFDTWRVEFQGAEGTVLLFLRTEAPHVLVRQDYLSIPVRLELARLEGW